jgi:hypothetical protein
LRKKREKKRLPGPDSLSESLINRLFNDHFLGIRFTIDLNGDKVDA